MASRRLSNFGAEGGGFPPGAVEIVGSRFGDRIPLAGDYDEGVRALRHAGAEVDDLGDWLVTPAFVNPHTHVVLSFLRAAAAAPTAPAGNLVEDLYFRVESRLAPGDVRAFARMGAYESLLSGVGLVWDHYYEGLEVAEALAEVGLAGVVAPTLQDLGGPGIGRLDAQLEATVALTDPAYAARGIFSAAGPHATDTVSDDLWRRVTDLAERTTIPVHAHCAQSIEEHDRAWARWGRPPLEGLAALGVLDRAPGVVLAHALFASRPELARLDPARHALISCPNAQLVFGFPADVATFERCGVTWAIATDCAASNDSMSLQKELRLVAGFRATPTAPSDVYQRFLDTGDREAAAAAWRARAERFTEGADVARPERLLERVSSIPGAFHPAFQAGTLDAGALANAVAWDPTHPSMWPAFDPARVLAFGDTAAAIRQVWVMGRPLGERGRFHDSVVDTDDYRHAAREATARLHALLDRCGWPAR